MESLVYQLIEFFLAITIGCIIGVAFDVYRILVKKIRPSKRVVPVLDFVWWGIITLLVFCILLQVTWGEIRFYLILAQVIGFIIYLKKLRSFLFPYLEKIINFLEKIIKYFARAVWMLFLIIKKIILWPLAILSFCLFKFMEVFRRTGRIFRVLPRFVWKLIKKFFSRNRRN